jgi:hypothetical protein
MRAEAGRLWTNLVRKHTEARAQGKWLNAGELEQATKGGSVIIVELGGVYAACIALLCAEADLPALLAQPNHNCSTTEVEAALTGDGRVQGVLRAWASCSHPHGTAAEVISALPEAA